MSALVIVAAALLPGTPVAGADVSQLVSYDREVRPLLSDKCYHCHGPEEERREAGLRLDTAEGLTEWVVLPGEPDESELIRRISSDDDFERMPPPESHLSLTDDEKETLRRWIAEGATVTEHWSFRPLPAEVEVPPVADESWPRETIDRFILARLEADGLTPSPAASPLRILRRMTLDLTGLPPTEAEIHELEEAAATDVDNALRAAVDRLLARTAYGEHMAVAWLDAARYADSHGYQSDLLNTQWPYRDWVIRALNDNMPYDQFVTWQLAGDLVEEPTQDSILATAFNRMHRMTNEGGSLAEEWLVENAADRLHTFGTALLGLTMECSRCHDHKYDPITQRDYFSLMAFFNSIDENGLYDRTEKVPSPTLLLPTDEQREALEAARAEIARLESALQDTVNSRQAEFEQWLAADPSPTVEPDLIAHFDFDGELESMPNRVADQPGTGRASGSKQVEGVLGDAVEFDGDSGAVFSDVLQVDRWDSFTLDWWLRDTVRNPLPVVVLHRTFGTDVGYNGFDVMLQDGYLEVRFYRVWPGNGFGVRTAEPISQDEWEHLTVSYDGSSTAAGLRIYRNGQELLTEVLRDNIHKSAAIKAHGDGKFALAARFRDRGFQRGQFDELKIYSRALTSLEVAHLHDGTTLTEAIASPESHLDWLRETYFSAVDEKVRQLRIELREAWKNLVAAEDVVHEVAIMEELAEPRPTHVLARGAYDAPKSDETLVDRDVFEDMLPPFPDDAPRDRMGLAQWVTDPDHPLTARVFVNRLWANFFGRGLVETPENYGSQGALPTHPELLDWLSRDFVDHGWDIKRLCRNIVLSATYRQDSRMRSKLQEKDPENLLLARGPSYRLAGEEIRDLALAASGLLVPEIGGPPVSPYQPGEDLWREANQMSPPYRQSTDKGLYRRSVYSVWKRTAPLPNMVAFDAVTREVCVVDRARTNTPLQALVLLNDVQFVEAAQALAVEVANQHSTLEEQLPAAFLRLTGRTPDDYETQVLNAIYSQQLALFSEGGSQQPETYLEQGEAELDSEVPPEMLAALATTCQAIMNLDATITKR